MQVLIVFMLVGVTYANNSNAQENLDQRINLLTTNNKITQVLDKIEKTAQVKFVYGKDRAVDVMNAKVAAGNQPSVGISKPITSNELLCPIPELATSITGSE